MDSPPLTDHSFSKKPDLGSPMPSPYDAPIHPVLECPITPPRTSLDVVLPRRSSRTSFSDFFPWMKHEPDSEQVSVIPTAELENESDTAQDKQLKLLKRLSYRPLPSLPISHLSGFDAAEQKVESPMSVETVVQQLLPPDICTATTTSQAVEATLPSSPTLPLQNRQISSSTITPLRPGPSLSSSPNSAYRAIETMATLYPPPPHVQNETFEAEEEGLGFHISSTYPPSPASQRSIGDMSVPGQDHISLSASSSEQAASPRTLPLSHVENPLQISDHLKTDSHPSSNSDPLGANSTSVGSHIFHEARESTGVFERVVFQKYDIFSDTMLPGYQLWSHNPTYGLSILARIPNQFVGWKAVLMHTDNPNEVEKSKQKRRDKYKSKVLGKTAWEVRQEPLKNSFDFRMGSGILATMHPGHRLFKHEWDMIIKNGQRYTWKMTKSELGLYQLAGDIQVAVYKKAVPSSTPVQSVAGERVGSLEIFGFLVQDAISLCGTIIPAIDPSLAVASLVSVFAARHGHQRVQASYEDVATDPLAKRLQKEQEQKKDVTDQFVLLPQPVPVIETESTLSDTTEEEEEEGGEIETLQKNKPKPDHHHCQNVTETNTLLVPETGMDSRQRKVSSTARMSHSISADRNLTAAQKIVLSYRRKSMAFN